MTTATMEAPRTTFDGLLVDNFAGGGGASTGIERAAGRPIDIAINHCPQAIEMHRANHPNTRHLVEDVFHIIPERETGGRLVAVAWFSPDCTHHSNARGSKPKSNKIRGLAWVAVRWARRVKPTMIMLENVREFQDWGPLLQAQDAAGHFLWLVTQPAAKGKNGKAKGKGKTTTIPGPSHKTPEGRAFRKMVLANHPGCAVEPSLQPDPSKKGRTFKQFVGQLKAAGYVVEWRVLNAADHGAPTMRRRLYLIARCDGKPIVWPKATHGPGRKHPYRTAAECIDFSLPCPSIFLSAEEGRAAGVKRPLAEKTMRRIARGIFRYVLNNPTPFIVPLTHAGERRVHPVDEPTPTVTGANRGEMALVTPYIVNHERSYSDFAGGDVNKPLGTITAYPKGGKHALITPLLVQTGYGERDGQAPRSLDIEKPLVLAFLAKHFGGVVGQEMNKPTGTVTAKDHHALVTAFLTQFRGTNQGKGTLWDPMPSICAQGTHLAEVRAFLVKFYGTAVGQDLEEPLHTITPKERFGLVTIAGEEYEIVDIGMRMLTARELARAQGFPDDYVLTGNKTNQIARIGNSVCPVMSEALVRANL